MVEDLPHGNQIPQDQDESDLDALKQRIRDAKVAAGIDVPEKAGEQGIQPPSMSRIGSDFVATILACLGIGWLFDNQLGTAPWGIIVMLFGGVLVGGMNIWRVLNGIKPTVEWRAPDDKRRK